MTAFGDNLIAAVRRSREALETAGLTSVRVHEPPDVRAIRKALGLSQPQFAARFGLPVGNVRDWEQGRVTPDRAAQVLLWVIARTPEAVEQAVRHAA